MFQHAASVPKVYSSIATEFSRTRYSHWNKVKLFIESLQKYTVLLDVGCGNGKYTNVRNDIVYIGCDITKELLEHAHMTKLNESMKDLFQVSCERLPVRHNAVGGVICIAVLHHIPSPSARMAVVVSLIKTLESSGRALITVWAYEQMNTKKRDTKWKRTSPDSTDYLIPWNMQSSDKVHWRFYHLFAYDEVKQLCEDVVKIMKGVTYSIEFELDNWIMTFGTA